MRRFATIILPVLVLLVPLLTFDASARNRLHRRFDHRNGLEASIVHSMAQDADGFLWIGVGGELLRFDGNEFRRWNREKFDEAVSALSFHPDLGMLALVLPEGRVYRVGDDGLERTLEDFRSRV